MAYRPLLSLTADCRTTCEDALITGYDLSATVAVSIVCLLWRHMVKAVSDESGSVDYLVYIAIEGSDVDLRTWDDIDDLVGSEWSMMLAEDVACHVIAAVAAVSPAGMVCAS